MRSLFKLKSSLAIAALLALPLAQAANISKDEYASGKTRVGAEYKTAKAACDSLAGNTKDICQEESKAKHKVALADMKYSYTGKLSDRTSALETKAETEYAVAKEKCDDKAGNDKSVCVKEAKAIEVKAKADARTNEKVSDVKADATAEKHDADYDVAAQKCDVLAGDAKTSCISAAKAKFGKS